MVTNNDYEVECIDPELEVYTVRKKSEDKTYTLTKQSGGGFIHECKATSVYGPSYFCRHKKLVMKEFYATKNGKSIFNLTPKRNKKSENKGD